MIVKDISGDEFKKAISIAFSNDSQILSLYDPNVTVESVEEIVQDIIKKVTEHGNVQCKGIYDKNKLVGYFVRGAGMLISFGLCVQYRVRKYKKELFALIKEDFKGMFVCFLWSKNVRGIRYLEKCGMKVIQTDYQLTKLIYNAR